MVKKYKNLQIKEELSPDVFCNEISKVFLDLTKTLNLSNTDFIRTTEDRHKKTVQRLWKILEEKKFIQPKDTDGIQYLMKLFIQKVKLLKKIISNCRSIW